MNVKDLVMHLTNIGIRTKLAISVEKKSYIVRASCGKAISMSDKKAHTGSIKILKLSHTSIHSDSEDSRSDWPGF